MGRRLAKFTLRHRFWLEAFDSPVVIGGEVRLVDLEMATMICAIPYPELDKRVPQLVGRRPGRWTQLRFLVRSVLRANAQREYALLAAYLLDHGNPPATHESGIEEGDPDGPPPRPGAQQGPDQFATIPGILSLVTGLIRRAKWDPDVVWALGPGEAEWYLTGVLLHEGVNVPIKSASDEEFEEGLRREREAKKQAEVTAVPERSEP